MSASHCEHGKANSFACGSCWTKRDAELSALRARVAELEDERLRALKIADALTLDTQSLPEAVDALVEMVRSSRRERDAALEAKAKAEDYAARASDLIRLRMAIADAVNVDLPELGRTALGRFDPAEDAAILGGVLAVIRERDEARVGVAELEASQTEPEKSTLWMRDQAMQIERLKCDRDAARRELDAGKVFAIGQYRVREHMGSWAVWLDGAYRPRVYGLTRDAALAEARKLAGEK